jgi:Fur family ferric uptake transcriptional regulator
MACQDVQEEAEVSQPATMQRAAEALQKHGYRITPQRTMILEAVFETDAHITADGLFEQVKKRYPHISFSTVYRTLELLRDSGIVTQTDLGGGRWQYHPVDKAHHHHLICQGCGTVVTAPEALLSSVQRELSEEYGFDAIMTHYAIFGRCRNCR